MTLNSIGLQTKLNSTLSNKPFEVNLNPFELALFNPKFALPGPLIQSLNSKSKQKSLPSRSQLIDWQDFLLEQRMSLPIWTCSILAQVFLLFKYILPRQDLIAATLIDDTQFIEQFLKNYPKSQDRLIHLPSSRVSKLPFPRQLLQSSLVFDYTRIALLDKWKIYLDVKQISAVKILEWLDEISNCKIFQLPNRSLNRENPEQNLLWFNRSSFHTLQEWFGNEIEKSILRYYFNKKDRYSNIRILHEHMMKRNASIQVLDMLALTFKDFENGWMNINVKYLQTIKFYEQEIQEKLSAIVFNSGNVQKKKKRKKNNKKDTQENDQLQDTVKCEIQLVSEKEEVVPSFIEIENNQEIQKDSIKTSICESQKCENQQCRQQNRLDQKILLSNASVEANTDLQSYNENAEQYSDEVDQTDGTKFKRNRSYPEVQNKKVQGYQQSESQTNKDSIESDFVNKKKRRKQRDINKLNENIKQSFKEKVMKTIINNQLISMVDDLSIKSNKIYQSKAIAFQRVSHFIQCLYPASKAVLFGSNAIGLALPSSDIDIMICDLPCDYREAINDYLANIAIYINAMGWVISCSTHLSKSKKSLVKLSIDTSINYCLTKIQSDYMGFINPMFVQNLDMKDPSKGTIINVDISFPNNRNQSDSNSTELMRNYLINYPSMHRILMALKYNFSLRGWKQNYSGGLGSYCQFMMLAAYYKQFQQSRQNADCQILLDFLKFYAQDFDNEHQSVTLGNFSQSCFVPNSQIQPYLRQYEDSGYPLFSNLLTIVDPLTGKLLSKSCLHYNMIKVEWRRIRKQILSLKDLLTEQIESNFNNIQDISKLMSNQKNLDKWINKFQGRVQFSISKIIECGY